LNRMQKRMMHEGIRQTFGADVLVNPLIYAGLQ
jgi:hypothetical protein